MAGQAYNVQGMKTMNLTENEPTSAREARVFRFNSPGFNRSKYLALYTLRELERKGYATSFNSLYVNSAVCYRGLICGLPHWMAWNYIHSVMKDGRKQYRLSQKGKRFLDKLDNIIPDTVDQWLGEHQQWRGMLPDPIEDWRRSALVKVLEPMHHHRQGHPGKSIYRTGGIFWKVNRRFPDNTHRQMLVLCPVPCHRIFYRGVDKRHKMPEAIWQCAGEVDTLVALFQQRGIGDTEARNLIKQSLSER